METSLKTDFAQIFSRCPKNLSCPKFGGAAAPPRLPGPYPYACSPLAREAVHIEETANTITRLYKRLRLTNLP